MSRYRTDIQQLRGLAVLAVLLFHMNKNLFPLGYLGVDIFFVISGYVITPLILNIFSTNNMGNSIKKIATFYRRRFYRLAPAMSTTLVFSSVAFILFSSPSDHDRIGKQGIFTLFLVGNIGAYKYSGNYFSSNPNALVHLWTLSVEEQIYVALPIILFALSLIIKLKMKIIVRVYIIFFLLSLILFVFPNFLNSLYSKFGIGFSEQFNFYSTLHRFWQFGLGALCFIFIKRDINIFKKNRIKEFCVLILTAYVFSHLSINFKVSSILVTILTGMILAFKSNQFVPGKIGKIFEWLGFRSYSIYLVHMPIMYIANYSPIFLLKSKTLEFILCIGSLVFSITLGNISYKKIEIVNRYKYSNSAKEFISFTFSFFVTIVPLIFLSLLIFGPKNSYWGLDKNLKPPAYAGYIDKNCQRDTLSGPPCVYNFSNSNQEVMLIGDSHAGMLSQAFVHAAKMKGFNAVIWTHLGCKYQLVIADKNHEYCLEINRRIYHYIKLHKPREVFVSQYITAGYPLEPLFNALLDLKKLDIKVSIVGNVPVFPDSNEFMKSRPLLMKPYNPPKKFAINQMDMSSTAVSLNMMNWAKINDIDFVRLDEIFCNGKYCYRYNKKGWLYLDADHLSVQGADLAVPNISNAMS